MMEADMLQALKSASAPRATGGIGRIALIGNFLPRRCGIATFTTHVHAALCERYPAVAADVYAMNDCGHSYDYPSAVSACIEQDDIASYARAAATIAERDTDLIWVQHEFGIFGGPAGAHLLTLLDRAEAPVIVTLHTVLADPAPEQRAVMERLLRRAALIVVMADRAEAILRATYGARVGAVAVVPHGIPDRPYEDPAHGRRRRGFEDRPTIMTFGLLSPDKGIETMIRAMPRIVVSCPDVVYRIVGATHPHLIAHEGEAHRQCLQALAATLGVADHLRWDDRFLDEAELLEQIGAADLYVTPYRNPAQITSGALSYAAGLGKPIVSTPYVHAEELLADGRGCLVPFDNPAAMANAVIDLLQDEARRRRMATRIYLDGRGTTWTRMVQRILETTRSAIASGPTGGTPSLPADATQRESRDLIAA
jgi:glycosyltransferase involved in cell wall biosynthesis